MKLKHKLYMASVAIMSLTGCSKYLETKTPDEFTDATFWTGEPNVRAYNWEFYNLFTGFGTGTSGDFYFSTFSDDQAATTLNAFPTSAAASNGNWDWYYIRKANIMIRRVETVPMSDEAKNHWKGVARFFRAFDYFNKVKLFGDVPWIGTPLDISDTATIYKPRDPRKVIMDSVLEDINYAIANLRATDQTNTVNKMVAQAFKSRVCLFEGTYRKYHTELGLSDADKWLQASKDASEAVMGGGFVLGNYKALYSSLDLAGNKEAILYKAYVAGAMTHSVIGYTNSSTTMSGMTKGAVEAYPATDGLPIGQSPLYQGDDDIKKLRANRDGRLLATIDTFLCYNGTLVGGLSSSTGYRPAKFLNPAATQLAPNNETDAPLFYLGEVLVNYAEAAAELADLGKYTFAQADLDKSINLLRTRAGVAKLEFDGTNVKASNVVINDVKRDAEISPLIWEIRRERRIELMMDGFRYQDLMRWKKGDYLDNSKNLELFLGAKVPSNGKVLRNAEGYIMAYAATAKRTFESPKHYLSAIPTGQISLYPAGMLTQNPGWGQ